MKQYQAELLPLKEFTEKLKKDYVSIIRDELKKHGYESTHILEDDKLIIAYYTLFSRRVKSKPRNVHISSEVIIDESFREGFENLKNKFEKGEDVNPHLSTLTTKLNKADKMFFDWGINHFHLGTRKMKNGFVERTGPIAYAVVKENDVYIVAVDEHGKWSNKNLMTIIDREWPNLIQHARVQGKFECDFDNGEISELRNANVNVGITLENGHSYISSGGGYMTDGSWAKAVFGLIDLNRLFQKVHAYYNSVLTIDEDYINQHGKRVDFELTREDDCFYLVSPKMLLREKIRILAPIPV